MMNVLRFFDSDDEAHPDSIRIGQEGFELVRAAVGGLQIVPTFIVGAETFNSYLSTGQLDDSVLSSVVSFATEARAAELTIRPATAHDLTGLPDLERSAVERGHIRYLVERIYRSWNESRARWYRAFYHLADDQSHPSVIIQVPKSSRVLSLSTRNPRTGEPTSEKNYMYNINNHVPEFRRSFITLIREVEDLRERPSQVDFQEEGSELYIVKLGPQVMSAPAMLEFASESHAAGRLNDIQVLSIIEPRMLGSATQIPYTPGSKDSWSTWGLSGSSGVASGQIVWSGSSVAEAASQASILAVREWSPSDLDLLLRCTGAFSTRGGKTSHLAVASRGLSKPAVVGADEIELDNKRRNLRLRGKDVPNSFAYINGDSGFIQFSDKPMQPRMRYEGSAPAPFIEWIDDLAQSLANREEFATLPESLQTHIAALRNIAAKIRATHD
jgi:phosphohistidine swiveling domain-containing protein